MPSIERTAYPRLPNILSAQELSEYFTPSKEELRYIKANTRKESSFLTMVLLLKLFQLLNYFPSIEEVPNIIVKHIITSLGLDVATATDISGTTLYQLHQRIREYLKVKPISSDALVEIEKHITELAYIRDDPVDLINVAIKELFTKQYELPAYRTINDLAVKVRTKVNTDIYAQVYNKMPKDFSDKLELLLKAEESKSYTPFNKLKQLPKNPTLTHLKEWLEHLSWLETFNCVDEYLEGLLPQKISSFAGEAKALDASELKDISPAKRYTLIACLIHQTTIKTRDNLIEMFIKRFHSIRNAAKEKLELIHKNNRSLNEQLIDILSDILSVYQECQTNHEEIVQSTTNIINDNGGLEKLIASCKLVNAYKSNNYLPLLWQCYHSNRSTLFNLLDSISLKSTTEDNELIEAIEYLVENKSKRSNYLPAYVSLDFASDIWKKLVITNYRKEECFLRREFEVCIFFHLAEDLKSGDICVEGTENFADYRKQLLSWDECEAFLTPYCSELELSDNPTNFVDSLMKLHKEAGEQLDRSFPNNTQLEIDEKGVPKLKKLVRDKPEKDILQMAQLIYSRMPERNLIDILCNCEHWTNFSRHFSPLSGSDSKLKNPISSYIFTTFAYGCNLGPTQMARHTNHNISAHAISYLNNKHINADKLNKANTDIINAYNKLKLPKLWGDGSRVAVDGTKIDIYEQNLLAEYHIRYGGYGGIAYHHVADSYIALFSHFIPCGVWEAIYIIDGLYKNLSDIQPKIVHGDTQAQSTTVFGLSYLLGIKLMPRIRNWKDLILYRPTEDTKYNHIDSLFGEVIDWDLIKTHWKDMMQVVLSIYKGKISSAILLRKLGNYSRKNKLYKAFRELGRVIRTIYLINYISDPELQKIITATTNKVESYNGFSEQLRFGGFGVLQTNNPEEQEKRVKYNDLVANAVMLQNAIDITNIVNELAKEGIKVPIECLRILSPYMTNSIKRFGAYYIDLSVIPPPLAESIELRL